METKIDECDQKSNSFSDDSKSDFSENLNLKKIRKNRQ
jgi:hypothetical protein